MSTNMTGRQYAVQAEKTMAQAAQAGGGALGHIVTWSVESPLIERETLRSVMLALGLGSFLPQQIKPKTAMKRALDEFVKTIKKQKGSGVTIRRVQDNDEYALYVLKREFSVNNSQMIVGLPDIDWMTELQMVWYKTLGEDPDKALAFSDEHRGSRIRPWVKAYLDGHTAGDISLALVAMVRNLDGISMRGNGGVYFVPQVGVSGSVLDSARELLTILEDEHKAIGSFLSAFAVPRSPQAEADMARHFAADMAAELKRLADDVKEKELTAKASAKSQSVRATGVGVETVTKYLLQADELTQKARLYADLLRCDVAKIEGEITGLSQRLERLKMAEVPF